jgi:AcrR family transcriptional regulator
VGATKDATRERILDAATLSFGKYGYGVTTNEDVARRAGITAPALYQYFGSKKMLYVEAVRSANRAIVPYFRKAIGDSHSALDGLCALARAYAVAHDRHAGITPLLSAIPVEMRRHHEIAEAMRSEPHEVFQLVIGLVEQGVSNGEIAKDMADGVVSMFLACTMGLSVQASVMGVGRFSAATETFARLLQAGSTTFSVE